MNKKPVAGIVLAAGMSIRFNGFKLLENLNGAPIIVHTVKNALESDLDKVIPVLGHNAPNVWEVMNFYFKNTKLNVIFNHQYKKGMSESIKAGIRSIGDDFEAAMVLLGDMPLIGADLMNRLLEAYTNSHKYVCAPVYKGKRGHPVIFHRKLFPELLALDGDKGAKKIIERHSQNILWMDTDDPAILMDIDTRSGLKSAAGKNPPKQKGTI